jgi:hypothetical protein
MNLINLKIFFAAFIFSVFAFVATQPMARAETVSPPTDTSAAGELAFWNSIKASENLADFEIYLKAFPEGMFLDVANSRYQSLGGTEKIAPTPSAEPETVVETQVEPKIVAPSKPPKKTSRVATVKKYSKSIFVKSKKPKQVVVYRKIKVKVSAPKRKAAIVLYKKPKPQRYTKIKIAKPYSKAKVPKTPSDRLPGSGGGGGGGGDGGGGGGSPSW